jgi:hypothetical protein
MATIGYDACAGKLSTQVQELAHMDQFYNSLDNLYHDSIGKLYDEFNIEIPLRFGQSVLWDDQTKEAIKAASAVAATVLNRVRVTEVKEEVRAIQKAMLKAMTSEFVDCACPTFCEESS